MNLSTRIRPCSRPSLPILDWSCFVQQIGSTNTHIGHTSIYFESRSFQMASGCMWWITWLPMFGPKSDASLYTVTRIYMLSVETHTIVHVFILYVQKDKYSTKHQPIATTITTAKKSFSFKSEFENVIHITCICLGHFSRFFFESFGSLWIISSQQIVLLSMRHVYFLVDVVHCALMMWVLIHGDKQSIVYELKTGLCVCVRMGPLSLRNNWTSSIFTWNNCPRP